MAGKPLNRLELRRQSDAAEPLDPMEDESEEVVEDADDDEGERKPKKKAKAPAKPKAKAVKAVKPTARMRIVWTVMNDAFKQIASFDYTQKEAADAKAAEMTARGKGTHFVTKTKEPMPDNAPGLGAAIPRPEVPPPAAAKAAPTAVIEDDEEADSDDDEEAEAEEDSEEE